MSSQKVKLSSRDYEIFHFLWRWKVATTAVIEKRFYPNGKGQGGYYRLWRLENGGFLQSKFTIDRQHHFWTLSDRGFALIKGQLPALSEEGFRSENLKHDLFVSAAHLGSWLCEIPTSAELFSEQELRRIDVEFYPQWVPKSNIHRPDGYWLVNIGASAHLLALEVELSQKATTAYQSIGVFYREDTKVDQVIWIVNKVSMATSIHRAICTSTQAEINIHSYILLEDFLKHQWQAPVILGKDLGKTFSKLLATTPQQSRNDGCKSAFFDTRKKSINSASNKNIETLKFIN